MDPNDPASASIEHLEVDLDAFLTVAHGAASALAGWHVRHGAHGRLGPEALVLDRGKVRLIAPARLPRPPLARWAPEQLRPLPCLDERSDLYALGAQLYLIRSQRLDDVPSPVEHILLRLLARQPEQRYQTARGLAADLEHCRTQLRGTGRVAPFPHGRDDIPDRLVISERLYGRQQRLGRLHAALDRVMSDGRARLICITGERGIGKSALAVALADPAAEAGGRMLAGKFDRYHRATPYGALVRALTPPLEQMLLGSGETLPTHRDSLASAFGPITGAVADVMPALGLVLQGQPRPHRPQPPAPRSAARWLYRAASQLLRDLAGPDQPLVLLLDDMQWADPDSLRLMLDVLRDPHHRHLLVVGTYRPQELPLTHPLHHVLDTLRRDDLVTSMSLRPLADATLTKLLADTLGQDMERGGVHNTDLTALGRVLSDKTGANPLFVGQLLHWLRGRGLLYSSPTSRGWSWSLEQIRQARVTNNLTTLIGERLDGFDAPLRTTLRAASTLADEFDAALLSTVVDQPITDVTGQLLLATHEHLLVRADPPLHLEVAASGRPVVANTAFRWRHDLLREAARQLTPEQPPDPRRRRRLPAASDRSDRRDIEARPGLRAAVWHLEQGRRANHVGALHAACGYFTDGIDLLPANARVKRPGLVVELYSEAALAQHRCGDADRAAELLEVALRHATADPDRARLLHLRLRLAAANRDWPEARGAGLHALRLLGIALPEHGGTIPDLAEAARTAANRRLDAGGLAGLPPGDARTELIQTIIADLLRVVDGEKQWLTLLASTGVHIALDRGVTGAAGVPFAYFGAYVLGSNDERLAAACLDLARRLARDPSIEPEIRLAAILPVAGAIPTWCERHQDALELYREAHRYSTECEDEWQAATCRALFYQHLLVVGTPLDEIAQLIEDWSGPEHHTDELHDVISVIERLRGTASGCEPPEQPVGSALPARMMAACVGGDPTEALRLHQTPVARVGPAAFGLLAAERLFYQALAIAAMHERASPAQQRAWMAKLDKLHAALEELAARGPAVFAHKALLVSAERARLAGDTAYAMGRLDRAIGQAREFGFLHVEAIAAEVAGRFARKRGDRIEAVSYFSRAQSCYARWGAPAKAEEIGHILAHIGRHDSPTNLIDHLDLMTVIKASQAISGELELEKILLTLLELLVQHAGAERGCLLLPRHDGLHIAAEADTEDTRVDLGTQPTTALDDRVPASLVRYVHRTREIMLSVPSKRWLAADRYLAAHRPSSLLCAPIVRRDRLVAILYLEHRGLTDVFTPEHLSLLEVLCAQAAVSLENAAIYARLADANRVLDATLKELPVGLVVFNEDLTVRRASAQAQLLLGLSMSPGMPLSALDSALTNVDTGLGRPDAEQPGALHAAARAVMTAPGQPCTVRVLARQQNSLHPVRLDAWLRPLHDDQDVLIGMTMTLTALTDGRPASRVP